MIKRKYAKVLMFGICLSALSGGVVLAETVDGNTEEYSIQITSTESDLDDMHSKVDQYVFEEHFDDFQKLGFTITHTAPVEGYIEVGISPYNDDYANHLYEALGQDVIKVVEGDEAILYTTTVMDEAPDIAASSDVNDEKILEGQDKENEIVTDTSYDQTQAQEGTGNIEVVKAAETVPVKKDSTDKVNNILLLTGIAGIAGLLGGAVVFNEKKKMAK